MRSCFPIETPEDQITISIMTKGLTFANLNSAIDFYQLRHFFLSAEQRSAHPIVSLEFILLSKTARLPSRK